MNMQLDFTKLKPDFVRRKAIDVSVEVNLKQLHRLDGVLADNEGTLLVKCDFTKDEYGIDMMRLNIDGDPGYRGASDGSSRKTSVRKRTVAGSQ